MHFFNSATLRLGIESDQYISCASTLNFRILSANTCSNGILAESMDNNLEILETMIWININN